MEIKLDFKKVDLEKWEILFGCSYANWTEEQKAEFLMALVKNQISTLDQYVDSISINNPFEAKINTLKDLNFEVVYRGEFVYSDRIPAQDVVMCNKETGMIYYATSYQDGYSINRRTDVKNSQLYLQIAGIRPDAVEDVSQVLNHSSSIRYDDGSSFHFFSDIKPEEVEVLLSSCEFVTPWTSNENLNVLNEGDCFNPTGEFVGLTSEEIQKMKIAQMPEDVQKVMGFDYNKRK